MRKFRSVVVTSAVMFCFILSLPAQINAEALSLSKTKKRLNTFDQITSLSAIHIGLSEVSDGGTYYWGNRFTNYLGAIEPLRSYYNDKGQLCRAFRYSLQLGQLLKQIRTSACREQDKSWTLAG